MDVYSPADAAAGTRLPAVVLVAGYNDVGYEKMLRLQVQGDGDVGLVGAADRGVRTGRDRLHEPEPAADLDALLQHVRDNAAVARHRRAAAIGCLGLLGQRAARPVGVDAARTAADYLRCGALLYGYMLDLDGATGVAEAAQMFRFTNPNAGRSVDDLPPDLPLFIVRAGQEQFAGPERLDRSFRGRARSRNRPITVVNHATGLHAFDLLQDSEASREIIRQVLGFLRGLS